MWSQCGGRFKENFYVGRASLSDPVKSSFFGDSFMSFFVPVGTSAPNKMVSSPFPSPFWYFERLSVEEISGDRAAGASGGDGAETAPISTKGWVSALSPHAPDSNNL